MYVAGAECCIYHRPRAFDESDDESDWEPDESDPRFAALKNLPDFKRRARRRKERRQADDDKCTCDHDGHGTCGQMRACA